MPRACAPEGCDGYYHVVSRINGRARLLTDTRREGFCELQGRVAGFCGVEVLTYCFMENHFHLLVRVPGEVGEIDDEELLRPRGVVVWRAAFAWTSAAVAGGDPWRVGAGDGGGGSARVQWGDGRIGWRRRSCGR
jgi:hypothetical protein